MACGKCGESHKRGGQSEWFRRIGNPVVLRYLFTAGAAVLHYSTAAHIYQAGSQVEGGNTYE